MSDAERPDSDAYPPMQIARRAERLGVVKAQTDTLTLLVLAVLAGAFISLACQFYLVVVSGSTLGTIVRGNSLAGTAWFAVVVVQLIVRGEP